jgi:hypothetical protein
LGSTQPVPEMNNRNISWRVKTTGTYGWQPYHFQVPMLLKYWTLNLLQPLGLYNDCFATLPFSWILYTARILPTLYL